MRAFNQKGFTLIELIIVIVIVSVLGVGLVSFITRSVQGLGDTADRQQRAVIGWIVSEKLSTEIRNALPNSFRLNGDRSCLEFIPTVAGSDYLSVPLASASSTIDVVNFPNYTSADIGTSDRVAVYPNTSTGIYNTGTSSIISGATLTALSSLDAGPETGTQTLTLSASHQFLNDSPSQRFYVVRDPVMFCFADDNFLYRFDNYGFQASIPDALDSSNPAGNRVTIANRIFEGTFNYNSATLNRSAVVTFTYQVDSDDPNSTDPHQILSQEVQVRNVP